jgi:hypothetical protein
MGGELADAERIGLVADDRKQVVDSDPQVLRLATRDRPVQRHLTEQGRALSPVLRARFPVFCEVHPPSADVAPGG